MTVINISFIAVKRLFTQSLSSRSTAHHPPETLCPCVPQTPPKIIFLSFPYFHRHCIES